METKGHSPDSDYEEEHVDYSEELKVSDHFRKPERTSTISDKQEMKRISEALGSSGLQDELTESDDIRRHDRSSDFIYTGNSGQIDVPLEDMTNWDIAQQKLRNFRSFCGKIVNNEKFQYAIVVCIFINAAMMGIATYGFVKDEEDVADAFWYADLAFLIIFTIELLIQAIYHGPRMLLDGWLVFDLLVVSLSWVSVREGLPSSAPISGECDPGQGICYNFQIFRAFRIFRALRLVTRIKTMKDLITAIFAVMPRMLAIFLMLMLIFYIFAVMFTQLYSKAVWGPEHEDTGLTPESAKYGDQIIYFKTLDQSMLTLFQLMTMDEWATVVRDLQLAGHQFAWFFIIFFIVISGFIMVNLIVAVICDAIGSLSTSEKEKLQGRYDSEGSRMDIREQIDMIEDQIEDLTRTQARTLATLEYLMEKLKMEKNKSSDSQLPAKGSAGDKPEISMQKRPNAMKKGLAADLNLMKSLRKGGFGKAQEGNDRTLRKAMSSNFVKSARELEQKKMKNNPRFAQSVRNLEAIRKQQEKEYRSQEMTTSDMKNSEWKK